MKLSAADALRGLPEATRPLVDAALEAADRDDAAVYLVGGPVRDLLLGRAPRDVDLLFEAVPERTGKLLAEAKLADARLTFYERFGTFRLATPDAVIDISTARRETYPHPGALPQVEPGTLEEDLGRRDFSCNALALALSRAARARHRGIVAAEGAREDLEKRQLRVLHRASFQDDPTRALRAARLGVRLGFALSRDSRTALRDALRAGAFGRVSGDRCLCAAWGASWSSPRSTPVAGARGGWAWRSGWPHSPPVCVGEPWDASGFEGALRSASRAFASSGTRPCGPCRTPAGAAQSTRR
jgi:tRNA nucleotidyltransferase (CCA-adding enzyme)